MGDFEILLVVLSLVGIQDGRGLVEAFRDKNTAKGSDRRCKSNLLLSSLEAAHPIDSIFFFFFFVFLLLVHARRSI
jgi:hypothetical protein